MMLSAQTVDFDVALVESVDEGIRSLLSQEVVEALYLNLKNKRSVNREQIPDHLPTLASVLEKYFGSSAGTIGRTIARRLYSKLGLEFASRENYQLTDYVEDAKSKFLSASKKAIRVP